MKCEKCHEKEATVFISQNINGETTEMNLCETCAAEYDRPALDESISFQQFLSGFMESDKSNVSTGVDICPSCGMSLLDFRRNSKVGCAQCYKTYRDHLMPVVKRLHGTTKHTGKVPGKIDEEVKSQKTLEHYEGQLKVALMKEDYEQAAYFRDKIRSLKRGDLL